MKKQKQYVYAQRSDMFIRIAEPAEFISNIVDERRPCEFLIEEVTYDAAVRPGAGAALLICLTIVVAFGALVACGLELVFRSV